MNCPWKNNLLNINICDNIPHWWPLYLSVTLEPIIKQAINGFQNQ